MKLKIIPLALSMLCFTGCTSLTLNSDSDVNSLKASAANVDEQIDNVNYVIYTTYERYKEAKRKSGNRKEITDIEAELIKLQDIRSYLEASQIRLLRKVNGT